MLKLFFGSLYLASLLPLYMIWSREQAERQIDKMQEAVFNSPGAESPLTPAVVVGGITLLTSHMVIARRVLQLSLTQAFVSMITGGVIGFLGWHRWQSRQQPQKGLQ